MAIFVISSVFLLTAGVVAFMTSSRIDRLDKRIADLEEDVAVLMFPKRTTSDDDD